MSAPPLITIDHVQVAEIGRNMMTLFIKISGKNLGQKTIKQQLYWILELEKNSSTRIMS